MKVAKIHSEEGTAAMSDTGDIEQGVESPSAAKLDPRIRRTRKMLRDALFSLLETEAFDTISVQQIAEHADVNRATFYAHYADREALLEDVIRSQFEEMVEARQVRFEGNCPSALRGVILAVYDFLRERSTGCRKHHRHFDPFVQSVVQAEVEKVLVIGLEKGAFQLGGCPALVAATLSWAVYGAAISALRTPDPAEAATGADRFVDDVYNLLLPILIPGATPATLAEAHAG